MPWIGRGYRAGGFTSCRAHAFGDCGCSVGESVKYTVLKLFSCCLRLVWMDSAANEKNRPVTRG